MQIPLPAAQILLQTDWMTDISPFHNHHMKIPPLILRRRPRAEGAGPAPLVLLRWLRSPLAPSLRSGAAGLLRRLGKPALPRANTRAALVFPRCFGSHLWRLPPPPRQPYGLPRASRALAVSLRSSGSLHASPAAQLMSPLGLRKPAGLRFAPALVLLRGPRSRNASPREFFFVIPAKAGIRGRRLVFLCHSRNATNSRAVSPSMFTIGKRCHSDGVLPASARQNDDESLCRTDNRNLKFRPG